MGDAPSFKTPAPQGAGSRAQPGEKDWNRNTTNGSDATNGVSSRILMCPSARERLSDTSAVSTVPSSYPNWDEWTVSVSQVCSPRQERPASTLKVESERIWTPISTPRGANYVDSNGWKVAMTPHSPAYLRRGGRESYISWPTTARSAAASSTAGDEVTEQAMSEASVEQLPIEEKKTEVEVPKLMEQTAIPTPKGRRFPWIGPAYTAVHRPPYTPQTREFGKYSYRAPAPGSYLEDYPVPPPLGGHSFENDPLLRSVLTPQDNIPYIREQATYRGQPQNYWHNDWMLDNVMVTTRAQKYGPGTTPTYADIPNFGRVQSVYMRQPDGTVYPLVTLPKMTPYDIIKVLTKMRGRAPSARQGKRGWWYNLFCCGAGNAA